MTQLNFDSTGIEPLQPLSVLPKGTYNVIITDSEMKDTAAGNGQYLQLEMSVIDGEYVNRKLWSRMNLTNPNQTAEEIARRELAAVCHAVGLTRVGDSAELHDRPFQVEVVVEKRKDNGEEANRIKAYVAIAANQAAAAPAAKPAAKGAAAKATPPWAKKAATA